MVLTAEKIKNYLQDDTSVVFGYLFGSYSDNSYIAHSDEVKLEALTTQKCYLNTKGDK